MLSFSNYSKYITKLSPTGVTIGSVAGKIYGGPIGASVAEGIASYTLPTAAAGGGFFANAAAGAYNKAFVFPAVRHAANAGFQAGASYGAAAGGLAGGMIGALGEVAITKGIEYAVDCKNQRDLRNEYRNLQNEDQALPVTTDLVGEDQGIVKVDLRRKFW
jgi:hypothetical protein